MSSFTSRWRALARSATQAPGPIPSAVPSTEHLRALALQGLAGMRPSADVGFQEWSSLSIAAMLAVATGLGIWWSDVPVASSTRQLMQDLADLPTHIPRSPHVPSPAALLADLTSNSPWSSAAPAPSLAQPPAPETTP